MVHKLLGVAFAAFLAFDTMAVSAQTVLASGECGTYEQRIVLAPESGLQFDRNESVEVVLIFGNDEQHAFSMPASRRRSVSFHLDIGTLEAADGLRSVMLTSENVGTITKHMRLSPICGEGGVITSQYFTEVPL